MFPRPDIAPTPRGAPALQARLDLARRSLRNGAGAPRGIRWSPRRCRS